MKIVCENCGAKYSIADEKVKGKVFKIRCKKCSESILVRGDSSQTAAAEPAQPPSEAAPQPRRPDEDLDAETRVFDYAGYHQGAEGEAAWHIVVDEQQQGPYTAEQINEYLQAGGINKESLIWREGFEDWVLIKDVPEFSKIQPAPGAEPAASGGLFDGQPGESKLFDEQPSGGLFGASGSDGSPFDSGGGLFSNSDGAGALGGDVFSSAASEPEGGGLFSEADKGGSLFDKKEESPDEGIFSSTKESAPAAAPGPRVSAEQAMMTGQRNENSVLFSLSNLQALAAGPAKEKVSSKPEEPAAPGFASSAGGEEASGLIDIRALAGSLSTSEQDNSVDDLISMGGGGFSPALGAPVLAAQNESSGNTVKFAVIGGAVAVLALIVVVLVVFLSGNDDAQTAAQAQIAALQKQIEDLSKKGNTAGNAEAIAQLQAQLKAKQEAAAKSADAPSPKDEKVAAAAKPAEADKGESSAKSSSSGSKKRPSRGRSSSSSSSSDSKSSSASEKPSKPSRSSKTSELDDLLGSASSSKSKSKSKSSKSSKSSKGGSSGSSGSAPKASLSRSDVQRGMAAVAPAVKRCGQGKGGTITMNIVIGKTGRVSSASATGAFAGTPIGSCAARAVRRAKFPSSQKTLTVKYPFKL